MERIISATYGQSLEQAVHQALSTLAYEKAVLAEVNPYAVFKFNFHGIYVFFEDGATPESVISNITESLEVRAELYDSAMKSFTPGSVQKFKRAQGGRMGEHFENSLLSAIQCGMWWGNLAFYRDELNELAHVYEHNGIEVLFNPWKDGEVERVRDEVSKQLELQGRPHDVFVRPAPLPVMED